MDSAEHDELGGATARGRAGELQGVAGEVRELDDLIALIVMPEDHHAVAQRLLRRDDPLVHFVVGQAQVFLRQGLPLADALLLDLVEQVDIHRNNRLYYSVLRFSGSQVLRFSGSPVLGFSGSSGSRV